MMNPQLTTKAVKVISSEHCIDTPSVVPAPGPLDGPMSEQTTDMQFEDQVVDAPFRAKFMADPVLTHDSRVGRLHPADRDNLRSMFPEHADKFE